MFDAHTHLLATYFEIGMAGITALLLLFIVAPYGRHQRAGWGPLINTRAAWVLMESPTVFVFSLFYFQGEHALEPVPLVLLAIWMSHYIHRTLIYPFRLRTTDKRMALLIVFFGATFNCLNAYVNAPQLSQFGNYELSWLKDPRFILGTLVFFLGYAINRSADRTLRALREAPAETKTSQEDREGAANSHYKIPHGGLYKYVSCPNYLGEIIEWFGFAVLTWSLPGLAFALYTLSNVGPRAISNHAWYKQTFPDYPKERRALIPFLL